MNKFILLKRAVPGLILVGIILITIYDIMPQPWEAIVVLTICATGTLFGSRIWFASKDDAFKESIRASALWGVMIGFWIAIGVVLTVRYSRSFHQILMEFVTLNEAAPQSTVAFGLGVMFSIICVLCSSLVIYATWWLRTR